jgi:hypothetical protein
METFQGFLLLPSEIKEVISSNISAHYLHLVGSMFSVLFYYDDGDDMFLRNIS